MNRICLSSGCNNDLKTGKKYCSLKCFHRNKKYKTKWERGHTPQDRLPTLNPFISGIITGFTMGEGSFYIIIRKNKSHKIGYQISPAFKVNLHKKDYKILQKICSLLGCGIVKTYKKCATYEVSRIDDLIEVIIPYFDQNPLLNIKKIDFEYFKIICYKLLKGEGKTTDGIKRILTIRDKMNGGRERKKVIL
jgi:hypothetical protein